MPYSRQAASTSSSRVEPPGSAMKATPWRWAWSMLSRNGMKPSETRQTPRSRAEPGALLVRGEQLLRMLEGFAERRFLGAREVALDEAHAPVDAVLALHALLEREREHLRGCRRRCQRSAFAPASLVQSTRRLLAGADADHLPAEGVAHRVRLGVLERDEAEQQVAARLGGELAAHDLREVAPRRSRGRCGPARGAPRRARGSPAPAARRSASARITMKSPPFLARSSRQRLGLVARRDDAVGDDAPQEARRRLVDGLRERGEVAEGALRVGAARAHVGERRRRERLALHLVGARQVRLEGHGERGAGRRDVLEGRRGGEAGRGPRLAHERPGVQRVEQVDVGGTPVQHLDRERAARGAARRSRSPGGDCSRT